MNSFSVRAQPLFQADPPPASNTLTPPANTQQQATPPSADPFPKSWEEIFQHPRFKELNTAKQTAEQRLKEIEDKEKEATEASLKEQNKWKELYDTSQKELSAQKLNNLRLNVATSKGLPFELIERLRGETEEEITKDADTLLELVKVNNTQTPPRRGIPPAQNGNGSGAIVDLSQETDPDVIRKAVKSGNYKK